MSLLKDDLPAVHIENKGAVTSVYVDGKRLKGVKNIEFLHDKTARNFPVLKIGLMAERVTIDTAQVFELPEIYHPFYVSSDKLIEAGILTLNQLNELVDKGLL